MVFTVPASIRVIKIVKDYGEREAFTLEFECTADEAKDLLKELTSSPYGQRLIQLLNESQFLPEVHNKTPEELKAEAEEEKTRIDAHDEYLKEIGRKESVGKLFDALRRHFGDDFVKDFEVKLDEDDHPKQLEVKSEQESESTEASSTEETPSEESSSNEEESTHL